MELIGDAITLLLPASPEDIKAAILKLKVAQLMQGFRGRPAVDMDALAANLTRLADFAQTSEIAIAELEINPLFVYQHSVLAVDVLIHVEAGN